MPKIRIPKREGKFFLDTRGRVRKVGRPKTERFCDGCGACMGVRVGYVCASCWAECKIFRKYLRQVFGWEPIKDDGEGSYLDPETHRVRIFSERVFPGQVAVVRP